MRDLRRHRKDLAAYAHLVGMDAVAGAIEGGALGNCVESLPRLQSENVTWCLGEGPAQFCSQSWLFLFRGLAEETWNLIFGSAGY